VVSVARRLRVGRFIDRGVLGADGMLDWNGNTPKHVFEST